MADDLTARIVEAAGEAARAAYYEADRCRERAVCEWSPCECAQASARAALAAAVREAGLDAEDMRDAAAIMAGAARALRSRDNSEDYLSAAAIDRTRAFLRALAGLADG